MPEATVSTSQPGRGEAADDGKELEASPEHPFLFQMERAGYETHAEIAAAVGDRAFDDAVRVIIATEADEVSGLIPDVADPQLLLGYPEYVQRCIELFPEIRRGLQANDDLGELRLNAAIAAGQADRVRSVACQFTGTSTAVRAHRWLGDQFLSAGQFRRASGMYRSAMRFASDTDRDDLLLRQRLAMAMIGRLSEAPADRPLEYRGMRLTPDQLDAFVQTRVAQLALQGNSPGGDPAPEINHALPPAEFQADVLTHIPVSPPWSIFRVDPACPIDWSGRAASFAQMGDQLIVASRSEVQSINVANGRLRWHQVFDGFRALPAQWSWTAHRLLCRDGRVFVRRLPRGLPRLACLDADRGKVLWESDPRFCIATDPVYADGRIAVLDIDIDDPFGKQTAPTNPFSAIRQFREATRPLQLSLMLLDADTGRIAERFPLARFHNWWDVMFPCRASVDRDLIVASVGGTTLCAGLDGRLRWVRQHAYSLPEDPIQWFAAYHSPPLIGEDRVVVSQPGVSGVHCLDIGTGSRYWQRDAPDLRRLVGTSGDRLLLQRATSFQALSWDDGQLIWQHMGIGPTEAVLCDDSYLAYADWPDEGAIELTWIAAGNGHVIHRAALPGVLADHPITHMPHLGPMLPIGSEWALACDRAQRRSLTRTLYRLAPATSSADAPDPPAR